MPMKVTARAKSSDQAAGTALASPSRESYFTQALEEFELVVRSDEKQRRLAGATVHVGAVELRSRVTGYLRRDTFTRNLVRENALSAHDLIYPVFVVDGQQQRQPVTSMPGVERLSVDLIVEAARLAVSLGIPAIALFPYTDLKLRTEDLAGACEAYGAALPIYRQINHRLGEANALTSIGQLCAARGELAAGFRIVAQALHIQQRRRGPDQA